MSKQGVAGDVLAAAFTAATVYSVVSLLVPSSHVVRPTIPGATQTRYSQAYICKHGTRSIRPPTSYTNALKRAQLGPSKDLHDYEEDHLIPLSVGGNPTSPLNLWPEPWDQAHRSDRVEYRVYREVCAGLESQRQGQRDVINFKRRNG